MLCLQAPVMIHIDNLAAQTGASLFMHLYAPPYKFGTEPKLRTSGGIKGLPWKNVWVGNWTYHKTEGLKREDKNEFYFIVTEEAPQGWKPRGDDDGDGEDGGDGAAEESSGWETVGEIKALDHVRATLPPSVVLAPKLWIQRRAGRGSK